MTQFVDVETPYAADSGDQELLRNLLYARACMRDCLIRGETPLASHLLYTQPGILDDNVRSERQMGIQAGKAVIEALPNVKTVVYTDLGTSTGMQYGIDRAFELGRPVEYRKLGEDWEERERELATRHSHARVWGLDALL